MAGIHTSNITSAANNGDVTIDPQGTGKTKIKSHDATNPGQTPLATTTDGEVKRLDFNSLQELSEADLADDDLVMVQDISDGGTVKKIKKSKVKSFRSGGTSQPPFPEPLPSDNLWVDEDSVLAVKEGGSGSTAALRNSVEFAVQNTNFNQSDKNVVAGQKVSVRWQDSKLASATHGQTISGTLYAKTGSSFTQTFNLTLVKQPTAGWNLVDLVNQPLSTEVTSAPATPTGMNAPSAVTIDGGTLTNIKVSVNGGPFTSSPGNILSGQTIAVQGTTGASNSTGYTALVSIGGLQRTWTVTTVAATAALKQPSITSPVNNSTDLYKDLTVSSSAYQALNGAGGHASSDWELKKNGIIVASSLSDTTNKTSWEIPDGTLEENTTYTVRVKYRSTDPVESPWSAENTFSTGKFTINIGDAVWGGYYMGVICDTESLGVPQRHLIACPKLSGGLHGHITHLPFGSYTGVTSTSNPPYGRGNFETLARSRSSEPCVFYYSEPDAANAGTYDTSNSAGSGINGYNDWYMPSIAESEVMWYSVPPTSNDPNATTSVGLHTVNPPPSVAPSGWKSYGPHPYTNPPSPTTIPLFKRGQAEAFDTVNAGGSKYPHHDLWTEYGYFSVWAQAQYESRFVDFSGWDVGVIPPNPVVNSQNLYCGARTIRTVIV